MPSGSVIQVESHWDGTSYTYGWAYFGIRKDLVNYRRDSYGERYPTVYRSGFKSSEEAIADGLRFRQDEPNEDTAHRWEALDHARARGRRMSAHFDEKIAALDKARHLLSCIMYEDAQGLAKLMGWWPKH